MAEDKNSGAPRRSFVNRRFYIPQPQRLSGFFPIGQRSAVFVFQPQQKISRNIEDGAQCAYAFDVGLCAALLP